MTTSTKARVLTCLGLRGAREAAGLTQHDVADASGWSVSKLRRFECGETALSPEEVVALARHYGIDEEIVLKPETVASYPRVFEEVWAKCLPEDDTSQLLRGRRYELLGAADWEHSGAVKTRTRLPQPSGAGR